MCGRFTLRRTADQVAMRFGVETIAAETTPRYNVAPTQSVAVVTENSPRTLSLMKWGLIPSWAKDPAIGNKMINARAETLAEKPSFKTALVRRRCLIPADGFYEWARQGTHKQPMFIHTLTDDIFAFAGLWDVWKTPEGEEVQSCTIITVAPNPLMATIHNRMPAMLEKEDEAAWLRQDNKDIDALLSLLHPYPENRMEAYPVSKRVNIPTGDEADFINPL